MLRSTRVPHVTGEEGLNGLVLYPSVLQYCGNREHILPNFVGIDLRWEAPCWSLAEVPFPLKWTCLSLLSSKLSHWLLEENKFKNLRK